MFEEAIWAERDYYGVLGVPINASSHEITAAYRLAKSAYCGDQANEGTAIEDAYRVLGDAGRRCEYDRMKVALESGEVVKLSVGQGGSRFNRAGFGSTTLR